MIRPRHLLVAAALLGLGACAALRPDANRERDASYRLERGLAVLETARYREAFDDLAWVYTHCRDRTRGMEALVALSALELDPRNTAARPGLGTDLLGRLLRQGPATSHVRPLATTAYLMARSMGAPPAPPAEPAGGAPPPGPDTMAAGAVARTDTGVVYARAATVLPARTEDDVRGCGPPIEATAPRPLPTLPGPSLVSLLAAAEQARTASAASADSLRIALDSTRQRLQETEAELERIRQTLKP